MRAGVPGVPGIQEILAMMDAEGNVVHSTIPPLSPIPGIRARPISAKCASRLLVASIACHYYQDTGREIGANKMHYQSTLQDFYTEWTAIQTLSKQDSPKLPALSKTNMPLRWCEFF